VTINLNKLHKYGVDGYPQVRKSETPTEYAHKLIVVGDLLAVLKARGGTWEYINRDKDPVADTRGAQIWKERNYWPVDEKGNLETGLQTTQTVILDRLGLIVEEAYDKTCGKEQYQEDHCDYDIENMNSLVALKRLVYIVIAIVAIEYRNKTLIERKIENPV